MKFNNRPNECVELADGRLVWMSRSIAVSSCLLVICDGQAYVLVNLRGAGSPDFQGCWNLPCGYLDYDESTAEAARREVWEECGVDVAQIAEYAVIQYFDQPWEIGSKPRDDKQVVGIHHGLYANLQQLPRVTTAYCEPNEVADVRWLPLDQLNSLTFAFHHEQRIVNFVQRVCDDLAELAPAVLLNVIK